MRVRELIDDVEQTLSYRGIPCPDRFQLLQWLSMELLELSGRYEFEWAFIFDQSVVRTQAGVRKYRLPENFPENFVKGGPEDAGDKHCCMVSDTTATSLLEFRTPAMFFSRNLVGSSNARPGCYTITTGPDGVREIHFDPPPDANGDTGYYDIGGLYQRTDWKLDEQTSLPPVPSNSPVLRCAVLRRCDPKGFENKYNEALAILALRSAQNRSTRLTLGAGPYSSAAWALMR